MVTEAVQQVLGERAVGICDSPSGLCRRVAAALGREPGELWFDYFGLNHLGWLKGVRDGRGEQLPGLLEDDARLAGFEEARLFGGEWLRSLGMIPNEYLYYFYYSSDTVDAIRASPAPRGAFLLEQQRAFYAAGRAGAGRRRSRPGAPRGTTASARTWPRRAARPATAPSTTSTPAAATRARRWRCSRRSRSTRARS